MKNLKIVNCSKYSIDEFGNVFNSYSNRYLKNTLGDDGYYKISLIDDDGNRKYFRVNRLVGISFVPNPENKPVINHKDGDKHNNHYKNLEWCTVSENTKHSYANGLQKTNNGFSVLDHNKVHKICKLLEQGVRPKEISVITNTPNRKIIEIRNRTYWTCISDEYNIDYVKKEYKMQLNKVKRICEMLESGYSVKAISNKTKSKLSSIYRIKNKQTYSDISAAYNW